MESFILDTNIFFNMEAGLNIGKTTVEVIDNLSKIIKKLKEENKAVFYMTPKSVDEYLGFFKNENKNKAENFLSLIEIESPQMDKDFFSAQLFGMFVQEARKRFYQGLRAGEEEIKKASEFFLKNKSENKKDFQIKTGYFIKKFREKYRKITREEFLDSVVDFEMIVLSRQKKGFIVSTDGGVIFWGRLLGVKEMLPSVFLKHLEFLLHHQE